VQSATIAERTSDLSRHLDHDVTAGRSVRVLVALDRPPAVAAEREGSRALEP